MKEVFKRCRSECGQLLPLSAYGVNKREKDGRSRYCLKCNQQTSIKSRARRRPIGDPYQRVLFAIRDGADTEWAIARKVRMQEEQLDPILVELILDRKQVVTQSDGEVRKYYTRSVAA